MRRSLVLLLCAAMACSSSTSRPSSRVQSVRLIGRNIQLAAGTDRVLRVGFEPAQGFAQMKVDLEPVTLQLALCPLASIDAPIVAAACDDSVSGVREDVTFSGLRAIAVILHGERATAGFSLEFDAASTAVSMRLPSVAASADTPACKDNGCNPFFELLPTATGSFSASAMWSGARGSLVLLQGRVLGRSQTATAVPYYEAARADGSSPLHIATQMTAPGEYALAVIGRTGSLNGVAIDARWPPVRSS